MFVIQTRYKRTTFSHATAAYLLSGGPTPLFYTVIVPPGYNATSLKAVGVKVYFVNRRLYGLGSIEMKSSSGNDIRTFNLERMVCDVMLNWNQMDIQQVNEVLKRYARKREKDLDLLYRHAGQFGVQKIVRESLEIFL